MAGKKLMDENYFNVRIGIRMNHDMVMQIDRAVRGSKLRWPDRSEFVRAACSRMLNDLRHGEFPKLKDAP